MCVLGEGGVVVAGENERPGRNMSRLLSPFRETFNKSQGVMLPPGGCHWKSIGGQYFISWQLGVYILVCSVSIRRTVLGMVSVV